MWQFLSRDRLIPHAGSFRLRLFRTAAAQPFAPDQPRPKNGDVVDALTPNKAIVPMVVSIILVIFPGFIRLRGVIARTAGGAARRNIGGQDGGPHFEVQYDIVLQVNGVGSIRARGEANRSASLCARGLDRLVDCPGIDGSTVSSCAIGFHIQHRIGACPGHVYGLRLSAE